VIRRIELISVPVRDQEASRAFYEQQLGFRVVADAPFGEGQRWIQLEPPGGGAGILLVTWTATLSPGMLEAVYLQCEDLVGVMASLRQRGVRFEPDRVQDTPWGRFAWFRDPDGNRWGLHEPAHSS
jgi:catechol 2,3-dioxygenase-like lactoylglutathione lyase family enzyme